MDVKSALDHTARAVSRFGYENPQITVNKLGGGWFRVKAPEWQILLDETGRIVEVSSTVVNPADDSPAHNFIVKYVQQAYPQPATPTPV